MIPIIIDDLLSQKSGKSDHSLNALYCLSDKFKGGSPYIVTKAVIALSEKSINEKSMELGTTILHSILENYAN